MASEEENRKRRREREDEAEREQELLNKNKSSSNTGNISSDKVDELINRGDLLIDQLNNLYTMFASGAEKLPPTERRQQLDQIMATLQLMSKPTPALSFKYQTVLSKYATYKERWDKLLKSIEAGKIKRIPSSRT
jgi:hypothetical protein